MSFSGLAGRKKLIDNLINEIDNNDSFSYILVGPKGCGKKFVMDEVSKFFEKKLRVFYYICDSLVETSKKKHTYSINFSISAAHFLVLNLAFVKDKSTKLLSILSSLKELNIKKSNIILRIDNFDDISSEGKEYISSIIDNKAYFEKELGVKIFILIAATNYKDTNNNLQTIVLNKYSKQDVKKYLSQRYDNSMSSLNEDEKSQLINNIYEFCDGNLLIVDLIAEKLIEGTGDECLDDIIEDITNQRLKEIQNIGKDEYNLAPGIIEDFLITCALSKTTINKKLIEHVGDLSSFDVAHSLKIAQRENKILNCLPNAEYTFISEKIKSVLEQRLSDVTKFARYYNYYTQYKNDDYFNRAYYIYKAIGFVDFNVYNLLLLAVSKAMTFRDNSVLDNIKKSFININMSFIAELNEFLNAYNYFNSARYSKAMDALSKMNLYFLNNIGRTEYNRLFFKCLYLNGEIKSARIFKYLESLKRVALSDGSLFLNLNELFLKKEEVILKLKVIFDISPYILDVLNEVSEFEKLYDISKILCRTEKHLNSPFADYIKNTFNRKAFLFVNPMQAESYYEEAEVYFYNNTLWIEYLMTLAGKAGILIAQSRYQDAIDTCKKAYMLQKSKGVVLPQEYKLKNNLLISEFLLFEEKNCSLKNIMLKAEETVNKLLQLNQSEKSISYVVKLNIASLYLYQNKVCDYEKIKHSLETEYGCKDIADINDKSVDDFYSFRFSWMEIYKNILQNNRQKSLEIINSLKGFIPALSHKQDVLWDKKLLAAQNLVLSEDPITAYDFCNKLFIDKRPAAINLKFFYRGLPLSALQFTSLG